MKDGDLKYFDDKLSFCKEKKKGTNFIMQTAIVVLKNIVKTPFLCSYRANTTITMNEVKINDLFFISWIKTPNEADKKPQIESFNVIWFEDINPINILMNTTLKFLKIDLDPESKNKHRNSRIGSKSRIPGNDG